MTIDWNALDATAKNKLFAERALGLVMRPPAFDSDYHLVDPGGWFDGDRCVFEGLPNFTGDSKAVLACLDRRDWKARHIGPDQVNYWTVTLFDFSRPWPHEVRSGECASLAEAGMVALLLAAGVGVTGVLGLR
jgi:hypothetical protein